MSDSEKSRDTQVGMPKYLVTPEGLDPLAVSNLVTGQEAGAIVLFSGVVRNNNLGRKVQYLEYDAYPPLAERTLAEIGADVRSRWQITDLAIHHRTGRLEIGEASLLVAVSSAHRAEAFEACHYAVDRVKQLVPVWKKEVWEGGETWIEGTPVPRPQASGPH